MSDHSASEVRRQVIFWLITFVIFLVFVWLFNDILLPFHCWHGTGLFP